MSSDDRRRYNGIRYGIARFAKMTNDDSNVLRLRRNHGTLIDAVTTDEEPLKEETEDKDDLIGFDQQQQSKSSPSASLLFPNPESQDHLQSTLKNNPLSGITFWKLCRLLFWEKRYSVDWFRYKERIICLLLVSIFNSCLAAMEWIYIKIHLSSLLNHVSASQRNVSNTLESPIFVLGHPRTGTTLLHSLLALDDDRFTTCSTFCAGFPHAFLSFEHWGKMLFSSVLSDRRPMDNMKLHFDLPQEDELATCLLTGGMYSPHMSLYFMRDEHEYRQYQTFRRAPPEHIEQWTKSFQWLCTKLQIRDLKQQQQQKRKGHHAKVDDVSSLRPRRLLLKSPCHTGRVHHLLKLYPNAQFVYIHRHPLEVFLSGVHMANTTYGYMFLQQPHDGDLKEYILRQGEILIEEYLKSVEELQQCDKLVMGKNLVEVSFEELTNNPYQTIESIYNRLDGLKNTFSSSSHSNPKSSSSSFATKLKAYCKSLKGYRRNQFDISLVEEELHKEIKSRWKIQYERFGYS